MPTKVLIKFVALLTALAATVVAIFWLKQGHMSSFWTSLGVNSGARVNWCEERVGTLYFYDSKAKLLEKDGKWLWVQGDEKMLDYLRVEKWFAQYCQIPVNKVDSVKMELSQPVLEAQFINGERLSIYTDGKGNFGIRDRVFASETLRKALKELLAFGNKIE